MNILPDYLITYMPEIEEALEELRLSVMDHAYELLQRLDVDELSTDEVRQKLELYDIKVDNMVGDWLPNGRFYRLYPSIKHHRSRHNAIKAIAKSGGQFEGLWSTEFSNKSAYQFKDIAVARHYDLKTNADGYFFVSGNTEKTARGTVVSSAAQALTTDVLINQALPAGYTYLYIPWPRPVYPGDSSYFYNVNMLMYDRLHYAEDCDHYWKKIGIDNSRSHNDESDTSEVKLTYSIYVCVDNSEVNRYCSAPDNNISPLDVTYSYTLTEVTVGDNKEYVLEAEHPFTEINGDAPFAHSFYDEEVPASTKYDWENGTNTPWRAPYWIDYHYMNTMKRSLPISDPRYAGTWPVTESGVYLDENGDEAFELDDALTYNLAQECKELADSRSTFPTKCYLKDRIKTTEPNRLQKFTPKSLVLTIKNYDTIKDNEDFIDVLCKALHIRPSEIKSHSNVRHIDNEYDIDVYTNKLVITLADSDYESFTGTLCISYTLNGDFVELQSQQFSDGVWLSDDVMPDNANIADVVVYDSNIIEFIVTDEIREKFERDINRIELSYTLVDIYRQSDNALITDTRYYQDVEPKKIRVNDDLLTLSEFYDNGWIMQKSTPIQYYYGNRPLDVYVDDCSGEVEKTYLYCDYEFEYKAEYSIDENDLKEPDRVFSPKEGPYRWDKLAEGFLVHIHETLNHFKQYRPFWNEKTPWLEMCKSKYVSDIPQDENEMVNHSLYNWMNFKQSENRPAIPFEASVLETYSLETKSTLKDNEPPISEVTFTSCDRPTRGRLDPVYIGYLSSMYIPSDPQATQDPQDSQDDNYALNDSHIYIFDSDDSIYANPDEIKYDPEYYYTVISLNYKDGDQQETKINCLWDASQDRNDHIFADFIGDPVTGDLKLRSHTNSDHHLDNGTPSYNYIAFKKSKVHKLWFGNSHRDVDILSDDPRLYSFYGDTNIYSFSHNDIIPEYTILEVYDECNRPLGFGSGSIKCTTNDRIYKVNALSLAKKDGSPITKAAYILFTVKVRPGQVETFIDGEDLDTELHYGIGSHCYEYNDLGYATYIEP